MRFPILALTGILLVGTASAQVVKAPEYDRGSSIGTTSTTIMAANVNRRGFSLQVQSNTASCYWTALGPATQDFHSLLIPSGALYESRDTHVPLTAISIICTAAATPVYAREW